MIDETTVYQLPPGKFARGDEYLLDECPTCGKANHCFYNTETCIGWCHSCQLVIKSARHLAKLCNNFTEVDQTKPWVDHSGPLYSNSNSMPYAWDIPEARKVLKGRKVTEEDSRKANILWLEEFKYLICPTDPISDEMEVGCWYRSIYGFPNKWIPRPDTPTSYYGFGQRFIPEDRKAILLVEGIYDILSSGLLGYAVALLGTNLSVSWLRYIKKRGWKIILWLDPDRAGRSASAKYTKAFEEWGIPVVMDCMSIMDEDYFGDIHEDFKKRDGSIDPKEPGDLSRDSLYLHDMKVLLKSII